MGVPGKLDQYSNMFCIGLYKGGHSIGPARGVIEVKILHSPSIGGLERVAI